MTVAAAERWRRRQHGDGSGRTATAVAESAKKKRKRKVKMFCKHCQKFNHTTEQCYLLKKPINQLETVEEGGLDEDGQEKAQRALVV